MQTTAFRTWMRHRGLGPETKEGPPTEAVLLPEATVPGPSVPDLKNDDHHDGRHHDRCGHYGQCCKHLAVPQATMPGNVQSVGLFQGASKIRIGPGRMEQSSRSEPLTL
jgi:hypothetical protein